MRSRPHNLDDLPSGVNQVHAVEQDGGRSDVTHLIRHSRDRFQPMRDWFRADGAPEPSGATWIPEEEAWNFALYSKHATGATLLLYKPDDLAAPVREVSLDYMRHKTGRVYHCRVRKADAGGAAYYAWRVDGPF